MVNAILYFGMIVLFAALTVAFGYCACTEEMWGPSFIALVLQGTATASFVVLAIREFLKS